MIIDLPNLNSISLGDYAFHRSVTTRINSIHMAYQLLTDLPSLSSITLGSWAVSGNDDPSCSLTMNSYSQGFSWFLDLPNLSSITSERGSFYYPRSVTFTSNMNSR